MTAEKQAPKTIEDVQEVLEVIALKNSLKYNQTKAAEEANELALVLLQFANKKGDKQPHKQDLIDEIGDVIMRIEMICKAMDITEEEVNARIYDKATKYVQYLNTEQYREI